MNASERRAGYLDDLGRLLQPLTPVDRIDVVDTVRARIDGAVARLGHEPSGEEMAGILAGIGAVEDVAQDALTARSTLTPPPAPSADAPPPPDPRPVVQPDAAPPAPSPPTPAAAGSASGRAGYDLSDIPAMDWPDEPVPRPGLTKRWVTPLVVTLILLGAFFLMFLLPALLLVVGVLLLWVSPLWSTAEKAIATAVPTLGIGAFLPLLAAGAGTDGSPVLLLLALVGLVAGIAALVWVARRGGRAARAIDLEHV